MSMIGWDVATTTGYAYQGVGGTWHTGTLHIDDDAGFARVIGEAKARGVFRAAVEDCYYINNLKTVKMLAFAEGRVWQRCVTAGLSCVMVSPSEWQSALCITGPRKDRKLGAARVARQLGADPYLSDDENDAVCLCYYAAINAE